MKVTVFGIGYVGLVQAGVLASVGHDVMCVDVDENKVKRLNQGIIPIYEPGLAPMVKAAHDAGRLRFTTDAAVGVSHGKIQFIAVGTPPDEDGSADLRHVMNVARTIALHMEAPRIIVDKSTVPVGTAGQVRKTIQETLTQRGKDISFDVVSNPEFLKEGAAVNDSLKPDRIIVGTDSERVKEVMNRLYAPFNRNHNRMIFMDIPSAELTKYAANCMLATKISFMNEMANLAERLGADIEAVRQGIGSDSRIGFQFIYPGCGYGGSCFPKDVQALIRTALGVDYRPRLLEAVEAVNHAQKEKMFAYIDGYFKGDLANKTIALWGLAFKPGTDDMRQASSRVLMEALWSAGARVQAFDPKAMEEARIIYGDRSDLILTETKEDALMGADLLAICTEWSQFRAPDFEGIAAALSSRVIVDGRNLYDPTMMKEMGFTYFGIGRGNSIQNRIESPL